VRHARSFARCELIWAFAEKPDTGLPIAAPTGALAVNVSLSQSKVVRAVFATADVWHCQSSDRPDKSI
jgi:hypothetical protein